ncbi:MAG: hypothetical protein BWY17_02867 [Deltaproteobacteria bacterium ADurb.Bin207]|nr:MAG: hypothetical protein BWY17_02867 [Deltaproteobacteria bacterium ADurb.Bin207]
MGTRFRMRVSGWRFVLAIGLAGALGAAVYTTQQLSLSSDPIEPCRSELAWEKMASNRSDLPVEMIEDDIVDPAAAPSSLATEKGKACVMQPPLSEVELAEVLQEGYQIYFGHAASANRLACAWAHCAFEHARGAKLFGNNLGHITTAGAWQGPTCEKSFTHRVSQNPDRWATSSLTFRVHPTLSAGAVDYWKLMDAQYPYVMMACDRGDTLAAARELRRRNYFTGPEDRYVQSLVRLYLEGMGGVLTKMEKPPWPIGPKTSQ